MKTIEIGQHVTLANIPDVIFMVTARNSDGSYQVEAYLGQQKILSYPDICVEMLKPVVYPA